MTDSFAQGTPAIHGPQASQGESQVFLQSIGVNEHLRWQSLASIDDPSSHVICGDAGTRVDLWSAAQLAFPDTCGLGPSTGPSNRLACSGADWDNCPWTRECGLSARLDAILPGPLLPAKFRRAIPGEATSDSWTDT